MEDKRLERLFDYTKFHIGIYLSAGGALLTLIALAAEKDKATFVGKLVGSPPALAASLLSMLFAGACGGVIASASTQCNTYEELWLGRHGPFGSQLLKGKAWAGLEHGAFWLSVIAFCYAVLSAAAVHQWLLPGP